MKYRHACHAGNFADVAKHVALVAALRRLTAKPRPIAYLDTHAGRARYEIAGPGEAEARAGILRLAAAGPAALPPPVAGYLDLVRRFGAGTGGKLREYPGSPRLAAMLLRDSDRGLLCELQRAEARALRREFRDDARFHVHCRDGYEALQGLLPPDGLRGLALIDPPYEAQLEEYERVADALAGAARRWPQGVLAAWYPIKERAVSERLHRRLLEQGLRRLLVAELCVHPDDSRAGLNGSGLVFVNPPWQLDADLRIALPALHERLAVRGAGRWRVDWLAGE